ncbi:MAG: RNase adapter RapZ [Oscillospiraceae bacterium]|nr:RNase adapter RapZ [Oscillospiraceae bacterium]
MQFVIISGLSGAGKSQAGKFLEDAGFYTVDNMPAVLMPRFAEIAIDGAGSRYEKVALVSDIRGGNNFDPLFKALDEMRVMGCDCKLLFLEASTQAVIKRYKETRRMHPLSEPGESLENTIRREKDLLAPVRARADYILDSTNFHTTAQLRSAILEMFGSQVGEERRFSVNVLSFGFKHGIPLEADLVMDVRFLPNPFYLPELRYKVGLDQEVQDYLEGYKETGVFKEKMEDLLRFLLPLYEEEGKTNIVICMGCTGGQHRSVAMAHAVAQMVEKMGYSVSEQHRDMNRERK